MRSSILLASALAMGAIATPLNKRYMVTEVEVEIKTVTVYVTAGAPAATPPAYNSRHHGHGHKKSSSKPVATPTRKAPAPAPPSSTPTPVYTPPPAPESSEAPAPAPSSPAPPSDGGHKSGEIQATFFSGPDYEASVVFHHNAARANHGAGPLVWDEACRAGAQLAADSCNFKHLTTEGQGQNLFTHSGGSPNVTAAITESWYKGELQAMMPYFGQEKIPGDVFHSVGHLTQLLWKDTTKVGCVTKDCSGSMIVNGAPSDMSMYTVCNYASAGNFADKYGEQVGAPISTSNLPSWLD